MTVFTQNLFSVVLPAALLPQTSSHTNPALCGAFWREQHFLQVIFIPAVLFLDTRVSATQGLKYHYTIVTRAAKQPFLRFLREKFCASTMAWKHFHYISEVWGLIPAKFMHQEYVTSFFGTASNQVNPALPSLRFQCLFFFLITNFFILSCGG